LVKKKRTKSRAKRTRAAQTEAEFLASYDATAFPRPSLAVDVVLVAAEEGHLHTVLYERTEHPGKGRFALPGGFVGLGESLEDAARRVLQAKAGLTGVFIEQLYTFGAVKRDPRGRVVTVAYFALVAAERLRELASGAVTATLAVAWPGETGGPVEALDAGGRALRLFLDHADILGLAVKRLRGKLDYTPVGFQLLAESFTLRQLQDVHETIRGEPVNKDSFRRRMLATAHLEATGEREQDVPWRPAELYRFVKRSAV
jgi:8-oxo-dGTP diphosphatase